ncbi:MAG: peptidylprolyl isomerase [Melioribacteraceae bacterium]|nr:peptidylprolyl isomerase [Melioribacteraceae bacterium]
MKKRALILLIIFFSCSLIKGQVIAEFGKDKITLKEFKLAYIDVVKKPNVYDSKKIREEFLDELIASRILAKDAVKKGINKNELFDLRINAYRDKAMREAHYNKVIKPKINITEDEIEETYQFTQEQRKVSHLFAETKSKADSLYKLIQSGKNFEELAQTVFTDSALANSGGDLGWIMWDQLDNELADSVFRIPVNKISTPLKSFFGYHIVKVTDQKKNPLITRAEFDAHRRKARFLLEYEKGEALSFEYITNMAKDARIVFNPDIMEFVDNALKDKFKRKPTNMDKMFEMQLRDEEIRTIETNIWDERDKVMATINGIPMTIADFIGLLNYIQYDVVYSGFKKTFDFAVRDFLLTQEAKKLGLQKNEIVKIKTNMYKEFLYQLELRREIVRSAKASEDEVRKLYEEKKDNWKGASYEVMKEAITKFADGEKKRESVPNYLKALLAKIKVKKNLEPVHEYYDAVLKGKIKD